MTKDEGLKQIDTASWTYGDYGELNLNVEDAHGHPVHAWLQLRPTYCDRGHIQLNINMVGQFGEPALDGQDSFPRYFFSFDEADRHTRLFLKWRLWKERVVPYDAVIEPFKRDEAHRLIDKERP